MTASEARTTSADMSGLDAWPQHRRELLLWRYALVLDYDGVEDLIAEEADSPCRAPSVVPLAKARHAGQRPERIAILGEDGRYHLLVDGQPICARRAKRPRARHRHEQWCMWWTDGNSYRVQAPPDHGAELGSHDHRKVRWQVGVTETTIDPALVRNATAVLLTSRPAPGRPTKAPNRRKADFAASSLTRSGQTATAARASSGSTWTTTPSAG